jgi:HAD superfamily hydrolase (TIGR01509 family)
MSVPKINTVIFDLDGVLVDATEWHYEALNKALDYFGMAITHEEHLTSYDGLPTLVKLKRLSETKGLPLKLHGFINCLKQKYTMEMFHTKCHPYFPHEYLLSQLKTRDYRVSVASNSVKKTIEVALERAALADFVDFFLSNQDVRKAKPDPEIYLESFRRHNAVPEECLIVEDSEQGIKAARASGAHVMVVGSIEDVNAINMFDFIQKTEEGQL